VTQGGRTAGKLFASWKSAGAAATRRALAPQPSRRRREETGRGGFTKAARKIIGRAAGVPQDYAAAGFLWDTLDWLNLWHGNDAANSGELDIKPGSSIAPRL
jgi:hypothetical protein